MTRAGKIAVVGAGFYGSTTALRLAEWDLFDELVMTDVKEGWAEGLALDLNCSRPLSQFETKITGRTIGSDGSGYEAIEGAEMVVITAGMPRKQGMSRMDLIGINARIIALICENVARWAPDAVIIIVSNPLDEMATLARTVTGFPSARVIGQAGMLDSARFCYFIAERLGVPVGAVRALTLGTHGETMVPIASASTVQIEGVKTPLRDLLTKEEIDQLAQRTRDGGAEVVSLLKSGSAFLAPSAAAAQMVRAVVTDSQDIMPVTTYLHGEYGIEGVYLGVEASLGRGGIGKVIERDLEPTELAGLVRAAEAVRVKTEALDVMATLTGKRRVVRR